MSGWSFALRGKTPATHLQGIYSTTRACAHSLVGGIISITHQPNTARVYDLQPTIHRVRNISEIAYVKHYGYTNYLQSRGFSALSNVYRFPLLYSAVCQLIQYKR